MASCKDCLHYEVCSAEKTCLPDYVNCKYFKDRNRFVEIENENENINYIRENLSDKARLIQLGEECAELSAAIFKLLRKTETDNPTPKLLDEVRKNLIEEIEDVTVSISVISEHLIDRKIFESKLKRWVERLKEREKNG